MEQLINFLKSNGIHAYEKNGEIHIAINDYSEFTIYADTEDDVDIAIDVTGS